MAVRSGAGTGVIVSLVVFVLTTVFLLVLTIVFYSGKSKEMTDRDAAEKTLEKYAKKAERSSDQFKTFEGAASAAGSKSVAGYLLTRHEEAMTFGFGSPTTTVEQVKGELTKFNLKEGQSVKDKLQELGRDMTARQAEIEGLNTQLADAQAQIAEKEAQLKQEQETSSQMEANFASTIEGYKNSSDQYKKELDDAVAELKRARETNEANYMSQIRGLEDENDNVNREMQTLKGKLGELERRRNESIMRAQDPSTLIDAHVVDVPGTADEVFIDKGKRDRIVLGMTFEVYSDSNILASFAKTGDMPRGKASLQVTKVGDATSTAKITRRIPGQPVVRGDILANAIYDPKYQFKFLIHGKFDIDSDGKPTETEAEYLRSLVLDWGGTVVTGETLPGDLDFLVLGVEPPMPPPVPNDASQVVITDWLKKKQANDLYNLLFSQAREAQIPVLNANRFLVLIGHTDR